MSAHLTPEDLSLAAMLGEPEPVHASHLRDCRACSEALVDAQKTLGVLDELQEVSRVDDLVLARVEASLLAQMTPSASELVSAPLRANALQSTLALVLPIGLFGLLAVTATSRHGALPEQVAAFALAAAAGLLALMALRLERAGRITTTLMLAASAVFALADAGVGAGAGTLAVAVGVKCVAIEVGASVAALAAARLAFGAALGRHAQRWAACAASGALAGQASLALTCHAPEAMLHSVTFHLGGVVVAVLLGVAGSKLLAVRSAAAL